ncbi:Threonylcarbamoyl-AMP synthase [bacterium HR21]|nr:Threonylcarbamoyl-AMP synthase [bacterium HR21]
MKALRLHLHPVTPERHKLERIAEALRQGALILYPTDTGFALGCQLGNKLAIDRLRLIRRLPAGKPLTFLCDSLKHLADFAYVSNAAYRLLKRLVPGPYTFILPATRAVPYYAQDLKRKTAGIRVPDFPVCLALLRTFGSPLVSISALSDEEEVLPLEDLLERYSSQVDIIVETDTPAFVGPSTIIDLTREPFRILRRGAGLERALEVYPLLEEAA